MAAVQLRDIVTDEDRARALAVRRGPGQEHFVASVEKSFADALESPEACPRYWTVNDGEEVVGFVMISDGVPAAAIEADPTIIGPYFLWRLLIDERHQRHGYGTATLDALLEYLHDRVADDGHPRRPAPDDAHLVRLEPRRRRPRRGARLR